MGKFVRKVSLVFLIVVFGAFSVCSLLWTTYFDTDYIEIPKYKNDVWWLLLAVFLAVAVAMPFFHRLCERFSITSRKLLAILLGYAFAFSVVWVRISNSVPMADQNIVSIIAAEFTEGVYTGFVPGAYLYGFAHQIGYTAYVELLYHVFGAGNYHAVQYLNSLWICLTLFSLYQITALTFKDERTCRTTVFLLFFCLPLYFYSVFVYGNIPALALSLFSLWMLLMYFEKKQWRYLAVAMVSIGLALLLKSNSLIFLIAMAILLFVYEWKQKNKWRLLLVVVLFVVSQLPGTLVNLQYEVRTGIPVGKNGIPKITWIAMGMQEGKWAEGWYNDFPLNTYIEFGYDEEAVGEAASAALKESLQNFAENPGYALQFFSKKFISQWNEPSYQCYMIGHEAAGGRSRLANSFYYNTLHRVTLGFMNVYQFVIMAGAFACFLKKRKELTLSGLAMGIVIIGGVLFHLLGEAKCQYALWYFVLMIPYAAAGLQVFTSTGKNGIMH